MPTEMQTFELDPFDVDTDTTGRREPGPGAEGGMTASEATDAEARAWLAVKAARAQFEWDSDEHRAARRAWRVVDDRAFEAEQMRGRKDRA